MRARISPFQKRIVSALVLIPLAGLVAMAGEWLFLLLVAAFAGFSLWEWMRFSRCSPRRTHDRLIGAAYLTACFGTFVAIHDYLPHGPYLALSLLLAVAASDIGAYFAGRAIGGPKLAPAISPNKTWAGFGGAMGACALVLTLCYGMSGAFGMALPPVAGGMAGVLAAGLVLGAAGQAGDLFVSIHKRRCGVKDTGSLIPGHGGLLDRIDSHLLAAPVFFILYALGV